MVPERWAGLQQAGDLEVSTRSSQEGVSGHGGQGSWTAGPDWPQDPWEPYLGPMWRQTGGLGRRGGRGNQDRVSAGPEAETAGRGG